MNIVQKKIDDLSAILTLHIEKSDYEPQVKKSLNDYRRKAEFKGFRPGMAPMSLIEKMHGRTALMEEINKLLQENLNKYIQENKLSLLGEPIPGDAGGEQNRENPDGFDFVFEIGLAPELSLPLSGEDKIPFYHITVTEEDKAKRKAAVLEKNGQLTVVETVAGGDEYLQVDLAQGEKIINDTGFSYQAIKDAATKELFTGKKAGDELEADVTKIAANETGLATLLKVKKEELAAIDPLFTVKIKEVKRFVPAELNRELYDRLFGKDAVNSEEEFMQKIAEQLSEEYMHESDYRFSIDAYNALVQKANIRLPDAFLKRWLNYSNDGKITPDVLEKEYPAFAEDLRRQLIRSHILEEQKITLTDDDFLAHAKKMAWYQLQMYGVHNASEEQIAHFANSILSNENEFKRIREKIESDKVIAYVKATVTLDTKEITNDNLQKLYEK
ncbi:MAG: trigger factor [Prevotellaceae bacterium]|jgi:trigger factor|nr:trigger factor [Prevotellaceae bacterium]